VNLQDFAFCVGLYRTCSGVSRYTNKVTQTIRLVPH
jgi:hypothetical protein